MKKSGGILLFILIAAIVGPWISPHEFHITNFNAMLLPPVPLYRSGSKP